MNGDNQRELPLSTFWYTVTFFAGLYWGISFYSGAWGSSLITPLLAPPAICLSVAIFEAAGDRIRIILGALTLYGNFLFTFAIGYTLAGAGVIQFSYNSNSTTQAEPSLSEARRDLLSLASQIELKQSQQDVRVAFKRQGSNNLTLVDPDSNIWVVKTPFEFFGANWLLWVQFYAGKVSGVRVRTEHDGENIPQGAPADRILPGQPKELFPRPRLF